MQMKRGSGVLLHITSLPGPYGIGDLGPEAFRFVDTLADAHQRYWQILPVNPTNPATNNSPYFSSSALAGNPLLVSPDFLVRDGLITRSEADNVKMPESSDVDFEKIIPRKEALLDSAFKRFLKCDTNRVSFEKFCNEQQHWLDDFSAFKVIKTLQHEKEWSLWPPDLRDHTPEHVTTVEADHAIEFRKQKFYQYLFYRQWHELKSYCNKKGIKIFGDMPIYVAYDSADVWNNPHVFKLTRDKKLNAVSGVPPDYFSKTGQLWNTPVYNWEYLEKTGFAWWLKRLEHAFSLYDILRIDHFRGLVQYWEVSSGEKTAINGKWADVPSEKFFDTLVNRFPGVPIVAEDLGTITDDVKEIMRKYNFPGMKVLLFAFGEDDPDHPYLPENFSENCIVYTGTHDNSTVMGWLTDTSHKEEKKRFYRYLGKEPEGPEAVYEMIRLAMESVAGAAIIPMQDILCLDNSARMNTPAASDHSWTWRLTTPQADRSHLDRVAEMTEKYGRKGES
ncbi:MAG: 4-alpha-glucanotransferase [Chitinivibrionales bacterium]|nr:4-alpha-glucanotransferase [Chitinivibrionales bacterium]